MATSIKYILDNQKGSPNMSTRTTQQNIYFKPRQANNC